MQSNNTTTTTTTASGESVPTKELILLARHICRTTGSISPTTLFEYFPSIDMNCNVQIIESLLASGHVKRNKRGYYTFIDLENRLETGELDEEVDTLVKVKQGVLNSVCVNLHSGTLARVTANSESKHGTFRRPHTESTSRCSEPKENVRNSTLFEENEPAAGMMIADARTSLFTDAKEEFNCEPKLAASKPNPASSNNSTYSWTKSPWSLSSSSLSSSSLSPLSSLSSTAKSDLIGKEPQSRLWNDIRTRSTTEIGFDAEFIRKLESCVRLPNLPAGKESRHKSSNTSSNTSSSTSSNTSSSTSSTADAQLEAATKSKVHLKQLAAGSVASSGTSSEHDNASQTSQISQNVPKQLQQRYQWKKPVKKDEVRDPRKALDIFCIWNRLKPPAYTVTFMPSDNVYFCLVLVGNTSFKSYPTMARTEKRAMDVAAGKAVEALGLTDSMIDKVLTDTDRNDAN